MEGQMTLPFRVLQCVLLHCCLEPSRFLIWSSVMTVPRSAFPCSAILVVSSLCVPVTALPSRALLSLMRDRPGRSPCG